MIRPELIQLGQLKAGKTTQPPFIDKGETSGEVDMVEEQHTLRRQPSDNVLPGI